MAYRQQRQLIGHESTLSNLPDSEAMIRDRYQSIESMQPVSNLAGKSVLVVCRWLIGHNEGQPAWGDSGAKPLLSSLR
jgi:hypothetical protein